MMTNKLFSFVLPALMTLLISSSDAFVTRSVTTTTTTGRRSTTCQHLVVDAAMELADTAATSIAVPAFIVDSGLMLGGATTVFQKLSPITKAMETAKQILTPDLEAQVVTDVNHVISDFTAFFRPSRNVMKMYSIIGRLLVLMADYIPDHSVNPEELVVQLALIGMGVNDLMNDPSFSFADLTNGSFFTTTNSATAEDGATSSSFDGDDFSSDEFAFDFGDLEL